MNAKPAEPLSLVRIAQLVGSAVAGGVLAAAFAWVVAVSVPWLFRPHGVFPYVVPELVTNGVAAVAAGSAVLALPVAVVFGVPVLFAAFRWAKQPVCIASLAGCAIGPALLAALFLHSGPPPYGNAAVLLSVAVFGLLGAFSSASLLSQFGNAAELRGAA
jgi:hypothetical protein